MHKPTLESAKRFFSQLSIVSFNQVDPPKVMSECWMHTCYFIQLDIFTEKLLELNAGADPLIAVNEEDILPLEGLMNGENPHAMQMQTLWKLLQWPAGMFAMLLPCITLLVSVSF
jgi:hypothetical protein